MLPDLGFKWSGEDCLEPFNQWLTCRTSLTVRKGRTNVCVPRGAIESAS
jgi:hypothetical protein